MIIKGYRLCLYQCNFDQLRLINDIENIEARTISSKINREFIIAVKIEHQIQFPIFTWWSYLSSLSRKSNASGDTKC